MCKTGGEYRQTAAGLTIGSINPQTGFPPVLLVWPAGAARRAEGNLAVVQGGRNRNEDFLSAIRRELYVECGLIAAAAWYIKHPQFVVPDRGKEYVWGLLQCDHTAALTLDPAEVAAADWYFCPNMLAAGVRQMSSSKAHMFKYVFAQACEQHPEFMGAYVSYVASVRSRWRKRQLQRT